MNLLKRIKSIFNKPVKPLFKQDDRIQLKRNKNVFLGGLNDRPVQVLIRPSYILKFYKESEHDYYFTVHLNAEKGNRVNSGDLIIISKVSFECLKYTKL